MISKFIDLGSLMHALLMAGDVRGTCSLFARGILVSFFLVHQGMLVVLHCSCFLLVH